MSGAKGAVQHERTLWLFKRRAEELFGCDLARREDALRLGQQYHLTIRRNEETGEEFVQDLRFVVPPKEQVAYALTLIRPMMLTGQRERLAWKNVMAALEAFCPEGDANTGRRIEELRDAWKTYPPRRIRTIQAPIDPNGPGPRVDAWDNEIARKFLYGDLVHGDDNAELLDALGDDQVVFAAGAMASDGFRLVSATYQVMHWLRPDIAPDEAHFVRLDNHSAADATAGHEG